MRPGLPRAGTHRQTERWAACPSRFSPRGPRIAVRPRKPPALLNLGPFIRQLHPRSRLAPRLSLLPSRRRRRGQPSAAPPDACPLHRLPCGKGDTRPRYGGRGHAPIPHNLLDCGAGQRLLNCTVGFDSSAVPAALTGLAEQVVREALRIPFHTEDTSQPAHCNSHWVHRPSDAFRFSCAPTGARLPSR